MKKIWLFQKLIHKGTQCMVEIDNQVTAGVAAIPGWSLHGHYQYTLVIKRTWQFDTLGTIEDSLTSPEIFYYDEYTGEPESSPVKIANDIAPFKQGVDLLLFGTCYAPRPKMRAFDVKMSMTNFWGTTLE